MSQSPPSNPALAPETGSPRAGSAGGWSRAAGTRWACALAMALATAALPLVADVGHGLRVPMRYDGDALLYLPLVKSVHENGTHWENPRMGAVGGFVLYDFPMPETAHFLTLKLFDCPAQG